MTTTTGESANQLVSGKSIKSMNPQSYNSYFIILKDTV